MTETKMASMDVPPEKHVAVDITELSAVLKARLRAVCPDDVEAYKEVTVLLESLCLFESGDMRRKLRQSFRRFSAGARKRVPIVHKDKPLPDPGALTMSEQKFLGDISELMKACHFEPMSQHEWETALEVRAVCGTYPAAVLADVGHVVCARQSGG
jgi:hypothetical protein